MEERPRRCRSHHTDPRNRTRGPGSGSRRGGRRRYGSLGPTGASGAPPAEASLPTEEPNFLSHAFKSQYNLIGLGTALGFAVLSGTLLPIIVAAGVEMVVLPLVAGSPRFQRLIRARTSEEEDEKDAARQRMEASEMLQYMPEAERQRYQKGLENRDLIDAQTETVQQVLQLLRDQRYSMRDPRSITDQIDGLVSSAEETERGVKDMEDILAVEHEMLAPGSLGADIEAELRSGRAAEGVAPTPPAAASRVRLPPPAGSPPPPPRKKVAQ